MSVLLVERLDTLKLLRLNRPRIANALNEELVSSLTDAIMESYSDGTRTLVLMGEGGSFCSGFDLSDIEDQSDEVVAERIINVEKMLQALHHAPFLTVALVKSRAFGAGADMVCSCHYRIATADSRFCMPGLNFGILLGTRRLTRRVGVDNAIQVLIDTRVFNAQEALRMGFLTKIATVAEWPNYIEDAKRAGSTIAAEHVIRMFGLVIPDTRKEDMSDLIQSVRQPGLVKRITSYREKMRARVGKSVN